MGGGNTGREAIIAYLLGQLLPDKQAERQAVLFDNKLPFFFIYPTTTVQKEEPGAVHVRFVCLLLFLYIFSLLLF